MQYFGSVDCCICFFRWRRGWRWVKLLLGRPKVRGLEEEQLAALGWRYRSRPCCLPKRCYKAVLHCDIHGYTQLCKKHSKTCTCRQWKRYKRWLRAWIQLTTNLIPIVDDGPTFVHGTRFPSWWRPRWLSGRVYFLHLSQVSMYVSTCVDGYVCTMNRDIN